MIIKPSRRGGFKAFSDYLAGEGNNKHENEAVNLISDSLGIGSINEFCIGANRIAEPRRYGKYPLEKPIEHISIRTRKGDILTPKMIQSKIPELLEKLGYAGCPWILVQHVKDGQPHYHLGILRIDDNGKIPNPKSKIVCFALAQKFARELGFKPAFDGARGSRYAQEQDHLARLWAATAKLSPAERLKKFRQAGFTPAKHDKRAEVVFIDRHGKPHSLHRIPALKAMGLKQADITAAFGFDKFSIAALPSIKAVRAAIRGKANVRRTERYNANTSRNQQGTLRAGPGVRRIHQNTMRDMQGRGSANRTQPPLYVLLSLLELSRRDKREGVQPVGGTRKRELKSKLPPSPMPRARPMQATGGWWVGARAEGVYKSMIAAGATPEQAQIAVEMVYLEEEQRLAAEQRYLDWVHGGGTAAKKSPSARQPGGRF